MSLIIIIDSKTTTVDYAYLTDLYSPLLVNLPHVDLPYVIDVILKGLPDSVTQSTLSELSATICASFSNKHPQYSQLGGRIIMQNLYRELDVYSVSFAENAARVYNHTIHGIKSNRMSEEVYQFIMRNSEQLQAIIDYDADLLQYDYPSIMAFFKRGLERIDDIIAETPAQMFLRVAVGVNVYVPRSDEEIKALENQMGFKYNADYIQNLSDEERLKNIKEYYHILSNRLISLPGPILMHAGSTTNQMASCFLEYCSDSLTDDEYPITGVVGGIMKAMTQLASQSKGGAGTAISLSSIRSKGSFIAKTGGKSNGILPFMKMFDATIGAIDQSGKRAGVCTVYLEPWHKDILEFLDAADHFAVEEKRCKHLFFALAVTDLFFERLLSDQMNAVWTLFDPRETVAHLGVSLDDLYGEEWKAAYEKLEALGIGVKIPLMEIWNRVCKLFQTAGMPYILNKDELNRKSNSKNIGVIRTSNICTEIALPSSEHETAVCVLSSVCLGRFYDPSKLDGVDYQGIIDAASIAVKNLNHVIDLQYYPTPETRNSCLTRRAVGVGAMGLADLFAQLKLSYTSPKAQEINTRIYECIYYGSLKQSMELAKKSNSTYLGFEDSPLQQGILQFNMWGIEDSDTFLAGEGRGLCGDDTVNPWEVLKQDIKTYGVMNSEVTAIAPTMSSSIRMSQNEMHEPFGRNIYIRQTIAGSIQVVNPYMVQDLLTDGLWNEQLMHEIIVNDGSIQHIDGITQDIKERYQTIYEVDWKTRIDMMADRAPFISQSASFNHYVTYEDSGPTAFTQRIVYAWKKRLKTLCYYMHTETATTGKKELGGVKISQTNTVDENRFEKVCDPTDMTCEACSS